jgi:hypothetical protein
VAYTLAGHEGVGMGCLLWAVVILLVAWADWATVRSLYDNRRGPRWWVIFIALFSAGIGLGVWCGFYAEYQLSERIKVFGFPLMVGAFVTENGEWVDYVSPVPLLVALLDVLIMTLVSILPMSVACLIQRWRTGRAKPKKILLSPTRTNLDGME